MGVERGDRQSGEGVPAALQGAPGATVLVVDDSALNRKLIGQPLRRGGYRVVEAEDGEQALRAVESGEVDAILLDVMMPNLDGIEVTRRLKSDERTRNIPLIILSTLEAKGERRRLLEAGPDDFLGKPIDSGELLLRLRNLLRIRELGLQLARQNQALLVSEAKLRESEQQFKRAVTEHLPVLIYRRRRTGASGEWPPGFQTTWLSDNVETLTGLGEQQYKQQWFSRVEAEDTERFARIGEELVFGGRDDWKLEHRWRDPRRDEPLWLLSSGRVIERSETGLPLEIMGVSLDISELHRARERLEHAEASLRQSQKLEAIGALAGGVAHDFNNMLSVILSFSAFVLDDLPADGQAHEDLQEIISAAERAEVLTRQLLAFSRKQMLEPQPVGVGEAVRQLQTMLARLIGEHIQIHIDSPEHERVVLIDRGQFDQVVMNLAINARDAMPDGGTLTLTIFHRRLAGSEVKGRDSLEPGRYVGLSVADTGHGMDATTCARIFEPFFTTKGRERGTGLGLSTVYGIVKQSNGFIEVESHQGVGTTFTILLPEHDGGAQRPRRTLSGIPMAGEDNPNGARTILLVEDEAGVREIVRRTLVAQGYEVLTTSNAGEAIVAAERHEGPLHLLLTDVVMPRMNGAELAARLSQVRPEMSVLYMTGYSDDPAVQQAVSDKSAMLLRKPFTPRVLTERVREALAAAAVG